MNIKIARALSVIYIGLLTIFAILSGANSADGIKGILLNLPNAAPWLLAWVAVFIAWKNSKVGGMLFLILAGASVWFFHTYLALVPFLLVSLPLIVIGALFLIPTKNSEIERV